MERRQAWPRAGMLEGAKWEHGAFPEPPLG